MKIFCTIISIRQHSKHHIDTLQNHVTSLLDDESLEPEIHISSISPSRTTDLLKDIVEICDEIAQAETSLTNTQLSKIGEGINASDAEKTFARPKPCPSTITTKQSVPSSTESYRIRRALWRLRLYFEAHYEPFIPSSENEQDIRAHVKATESCGIWDATSPGKLCYAHKQCSFFLDFTMWELQEMQCAWYHLRHQATTIWRKPCPRCQALCLPDDLIGHVRDYKECWRIGREQIDFASGFMSNCSQFYPDLGMELQVIWPGSLALEPSIGYRIFKDCLSSSLNPHSKLLAWGYCMWDCARLQACLLTTDESKDFMPPPACESPVCG